MIARASALVALLVGCASLPAVPENRAEFERAVGQSCDAMQNVCAIYEALPSDARNARDDLTCAHARKWCADPASP